MTYPNAFVRYHANDVQLQIDSDATYLVEPNARSRIAGYFQLNKGTTRIPVVCTPGLSFGVRVGCLGSGAVPQQEIIKGRYP